MVLLLFFIVMSATTANCFDEFISDCKIVNAKMTPSCHDKLTLFIGIYSLIIYSLIYF